MAQPPSMESLVLVGSVLENALPLDEPLRMTHHQSMRGVPCVLVQGVSSGKPWKLQVYTGNWFWVSFPGFEPFTSDNLFSTVTALRALIGDKE